MSELPWTSTIQVNRLFDLLEEGLVVLDNTGTIVHANQAFADCMQYAAGDLVDRPFEDFIFEDQKGALSVHLSDDRGQPLSLSIVTHEGEQKRIQVRSLGLVDEQEAKGHCLVITGHTPDFKKIMSSAFLKMVIVDTNHRITYVNPAFREDPTEMVGTLVTDGVGQQYRDEFREKLEIALKTGTNQKFEFSEEREDKSTTWHVLRIGPIKENAEVIGVVIAGYDITERVLAMRELQASEEKFRGVFEHANDAITLADEEGSIITINAAQEELFGIKRDEVVGMPLWELQSSMLADEAKTPEYKEYLKQTLVSFFKEGTAPWLEKKTQGEFVHPQNGTHKTFDQTSFRIPTPKGYMLCSFVWDTTEQTKLDEARKASEIRYKALFEENNDGVFIIDLNGKFMEVNSKGTEIFGYEDSQDLVGLPFSETIADAEKTESISGFEELMGGTPLPIFERTIVRRDGQEIKVEMNVSLVKDTDGNPIHIQSILRDVTERKRAQTALDESRERYELALRGADLGVWDWNAETDEMIFSDRWADILGYKVDEIEPNYAGWEKLIHPDDIEDMESIWGAHVDGATDFYSHEHRMRTKTGEWKWVLERGRVVELNEDGGTKRATGTVLDITERKLIEKALKESEVKYRNLLENIPQRVFYKDRDSVYVAANPAYSSYLEMSPREIAGKTDYDLFPKERADYFVATDRQILETLEPYVRDESHVVGEETRYSQIVKVPFRDDEGNVVGILGIFWDTTESTRSAEALRESETKYRSLVEQSVMGLAILPKGIDNIVFANPKIGDILGYAPEELLAMNNEQVNTLIHPDDVGDIVEYLNSLLQTSETGDAIQIRMNHKDGSQIWTEVSAGGIEYAETPSVQVSIVDITKRIEAEEEIRKLNEGLSRIVDERTAELAAANKELEAFAYSVSHDLRAPLRTIDGFSQALMEDYSDSIDSTGIDFLRRVRGAATHMGSLIEDLLVLSRVTRQEMDRTEVDLSEIASVLVDEIRSIDTERQVDIKIADNLPARCDKRLIKLVVRNLLDNAWKFTRNTSEPQIEFGSDMEDGITRYYVKDNGAGFDMSYIDKLFIPFQRLHSVEDFEGSGIGLATVQRVINRHGGRVWAESTVDEGSTFYFTIPE